MVSGHGKFKKPFFAIFVDDPDITIILPRLNRISALPSAGIRCPRHRISALGIQDNQRFPADSKKSDKSDLIQALPADGIKSDCETSLPAMDFSKSRISTMDFSKHTVEREDG